MTLAPAYGRDYPSKAAVVTAFNENKDFRLMSLEGDGYINKEQIAKGTSVTLRYKRLTQATIVKV